MYIHHSRLKSRGKHLKFGQFNGINSFISYSEDIPASIAKVHVVVLRNSSMLIALKMEYMTLIFLASFIFASVSF